jgi:tetratricopeptide (TPR) repeat protein
LKEIKLAETPTQSQTSRGDDSGDRPGRRGDFFERPGLSEELDRALSAAEQATVPVVVAVTGVGGVGKTTLVEQWAARILDEKKWKPGKKDYLFIDLGGYSKDGKVSSDNALELLIRRLARGVRKTDPEVGTRALVSQFTRLAASRSFLLIVLDNALNAEHVRSLIPSRGRALVIITTRGPTMGGLEVRPGISPREIKVDRLGDEEGLFRLEESIGAVREEDRGALKAVAGYCCGLPLAIKIAATVIKVGDYSLRQLAERMKEPDGFAVLTTGDEESALEPVIQASYACLSADAQEAFLLLGLRLGQGIDDVAVALLTGTRINVAGRLLREIHRVGLAEKHHGRFSLHDLIHGFAVTHGPGRDSDLGRAALSRMVAGYYWCVNYEFSRRNDNNPMVDADFVDEHASLAPGGAEAVENSPDWFATERANLIDLTVRSCRARPPLEMGPGLAFSLFYSLEAGGYWADWDMVTKDGLRASGELGDALNLARLTRNVGRLGFVKVRDRAEALQADPAGNQEQQHAVRAQCLQAIAALEDSIRLYSQCTPQPTAAVVTSRREIADVRLELARHDPEESSRAIDGYLKVWRQYEELPSPANPVASLKVSLSAAYRIAGRYKECEACLEQALDYAQQLNEHGTPKHARIIGYGCLRRAELEEALGEAHLEAAAEWYAKAADRFRQDKNLLAEARALARQGRLLARLSRTSQARDLMNCAVKIMGENHPDETAVIQSWIDALPAAAAD